MATRVDPTRARPDAVAARMAALAALAAARAVAPGRHDADPARHLEVVLSGVPFEEAGVTGFFDGLASCVTTDALSPEDLAAVFDHLDRLENDGASALGGIYMTLRPRVARHAQGEYYTPRWLVDHVLDRAGFEVASGCRMIDPMCGGGAFLAAAVSRLRRARPAIPVEEINRRVAGCDLNPLAVLMARAAYLIALGPPPRGTTFRIPVDRRDALTPIPQRDAFHIVAGNPPWVGWESLSPEVRARTRGLWLHHGIFTSISRDGETGGTPGGLGALLGGGRKDLCMLATFVAADRYLAPGGRLSFIVTRSVFTGASGAGFRRFRLGDGTPLRVIAVDDLGALRVFPGAASRACVLTLEKGAPTRFPVAWHVWKDRSSPPVAREAEPVAPDDPSSAWLAGSATMRRRVRRVTGPSDYRARAGAYTGGANGVFWIDVRAWNDDGTCLAENIAAAARHPIPRRRALLEQALVFPLLHARDVGRFAAKPSAWILLTHDPARRRGLAPEVMASRHPRALEWLEAFRDVLDARRDRGTRALIEAGAPWWSLFSVSEETLSPWKVVWRRIASRLEAAVVGPFRAEGRHDARPVIPQETCTFVACATEDEAGYLAGIMNASIVTEAARAFGQPGGKGFGTPGLLRHIGVPRFDPAREAHRALAARVLEAGPALPQGECDALVARAWPAAAISSAITGSTAPSPR